MDLITKQGFDFSFDPKACERCNSRCCRGVSGNIWVTRQDIDSICESLNINVIDGLDRYFKRVGNRFSIKEIFSGDEYLCVFLDPGQGCLIYGSRPVQCRTFPFWNHFRSKPEELSNQCPGIVHGM